MRLHNLLNDFRFYGPIAIIYFEQVTSSYALGLAIFSIASISATIFEVPTGVVSDRIGRKYTIVVGSIASTVSIALFAIAPSFALLAIGAIFGGLSQSLFSGNNDALLYDTLKEDNREKDFAEVLGKTASMFQVGLGLAALVGGFVAGYSMQIVFALAIIPQFLSVLVALLFVEPQIHTNEIEDNILAHFKKAWSGFKENARLRKLSLAHILDHGIGQTAHQFMPAFIGSIWPLWALGIARSFDHLLAFLGFNFAGRVIKKFGALKTLLSTTIIGRTISLIFIGFPNITTPAVLSLGSVLFGVGSTASRSLLHQEFSDKQRATMGSLNTLAGTLLFSVFALIIGRIADIIGPIRTLLIVEVCMISVPLIYWNLFKKHAKKSSLF